MQTAIIAGLTKTGLVAASQAHELIGRVEKRHIIRAAKEIGRNGIQGEFRNGRENVVEIGGGLYPPKAICSAAVRLAVGVDLTPKHFNGSFNGPWLNMLRDFECPVLKRSQIIHSRPPRTKSRSVILSLKEAEEGFREDRTAVFRTRNKQVIQACKARDKHTCQACGFNAIVLGNAVIDCHHLDPLANAPEGVVTSIDRLICLCPTCHRIAHTRNPPLLLPEIQKARKGKLSCVQIFA